MKAINEFFFGQQSFHPEMLFYYIPMALMLVMFIGTVKGLL